MKNWVSTWMGPLNWDFAEPGAGKHALSPFFRTWGPWLAASLIAGLVSGLAVRGLGIPTEVVTTSQQPVMTVALGLFISVQFRVSRNQDGDFEPIAGLVLRTVTSSALFLGACLAVALPAAGDADSGFLAVPTWLLFTTLLAILRPLDQELTQELAERELKHLRTVRTQLARSIGSPTRGISSQRFILLILVLSLIPAALTAASAALAGLSDPEALFNGAMSAASTWVVTLAWFALAEGTMQLRASARARSLGPLASAFMRVAFLSLIIGLFAGLGIISLSLHVVGRIELLPSQWFLAGSSLTFSTAAITALWGWPSPRLAASSALADIDTRIRLLHERSADSPEFSI